MAARPDSAALLTPPASVARRLFAYARPDLPILMLGLVAVILNSAVEPAMMVLLSRLITAFEDGGIGNLNLIVLGLAALGVLLAITDFGHMFIGDYVGQTVVKSLRGELFARMQKLSLSFFDDQSTGRLMSKATNDIAALQTRLNFELARLIKSPLTILGLVAYMLYASWRLTLVSLLMVAVLVPLIGQATRLMRRHMSALQDRLAELSDRLQESLAAIRVVQCFGAGDREIARFEIENSEVRRATMRAVRVRSALQPLVHLIGLMGLLVVLWYGGHLMLVLRTISAGELVTVLGSLQLVTTSFKQFGRARLAGAEVIAAAEKIFAVIDTRAEIVDRPEALPLTDPDGTVVFERVGFQYRSGKQVLRGIDLTVAPGEAIAVVGPSGAGKSTLVNLIPRLYDVTEGRVLIGGHDVREVTLESLRQQIGIVPQETVLFRGTIRENIAYGRPGATEEEVVEAARAANADAFIRDFPEGYETRVGERGKTLSGGQAQRVAIARALLRDPRILILDEATSSLDSQSEALVQEALERLMKGRTTLVIAHRLSTIQNCDRIVVLHDGEIVEAGSHEELLATAGHYRRSYLLQGGEQSG